MIEISGWDISVLEILKIIQALFDYLGLIN